MEITFKLTGSLADVMGRDPSGRITLTEGSLLRDLIAELKIPDMHAKLIFINGKQVGLDSPLKENDNVVLLPLIGGG